MIAVMRPNIVKVYNSAMGGVDLFDMFQSLYRMDHKTQRWYVRIFYWILASSITNTWLQYRRDFDDVQTTKPKEDKQKALVEFATETEIATVLLTNAKVVQKRPCRPSVSSNDWPIHREDRPKSFHCKEKTRVGCNKCGKGLSLTKDTNRFVEYQDAKL